MWCCNVSRLVGLALVLAGCGAIKPMAWPEPEPAPRELHATPGKMYGLAPTSWDGPGGRIRVSVERAQSIRGALDMAFTVARRGRELRCATDATRGGAAASRFECFSDDVDFWLAPGAACPLGTSETLQNPVCWTGRARIGGETVQLEHGYLERVGAMVGYLTWTGADGGLLLAADVVAEMHMNLYDADRGRHREVLTLLTVALAWFEHGASALRD